MMDTASRELARLWVNVSVLSAAIQTAASILVILFSRTLSFDDPESRASAALFFLVVAAAITACSSGMIAFLMGHVLGRKLPRFPVRSWIAVNALFGFLYGLVAYIAWSGPKSSDPGTIDMIGRYIVVGMIVNALEGAVQALVLRKAAYGVEIWIASCALAGLSWLLVIPLEAFGSLTGLPAELISS